MATEVKQLRGLGLPALRATGGYFTSKTRLDVAWGDLLLALFTPIGVRSMRRTFGSSLHELLFDPNIRQNIKRIQYIISETMTKWTPHLILRGVRVIINNKALELHITFALADDRQSLSRSVALPQNNAVGAAFAGRLGA